VAQVVADQLGSDLDAVTILQGDTAVSPYGAGTGGSRSAVVVGGAAHEASVALHAKLRSIAAHHFEAAPEDLELAGSVVWVRGTPARSMTFEQLATIAYTAQALPAGMEPGLEVLHRYRPPSFTFANACHACVVEVDVETGMVRIERYIVSCDCGTMINPAVVEGQIAGGVVQGIGGVLFEHLVYDEHGNPLAATFLDYLLPTAGDVPDIECGHIETPSATPGGFKGVGEGGAIGAPAAVFNAVADALAPLGVVLTRQPLTPSVLLEAIMNAQAAS
jgi:carbon-monoxide dehydrogenase large subunit